MADIGPIAGTAFFKVDAVQYQLRGSLEIDGFATEKEGVAGMDGVHGFKVKPTVPMISGDFTDRDISFDVLEALRNGVVTAELVNGKTYILSGAFVSGKPAINAEEGTMRISFAGARVLAL